MNENRLLLGADHGAISRQLTAVSADLARSIAEVIAQSAGGDQASASAISFLRDWADSAGPVLPAAGLPLDLLTEHYRLVSAERDLILLAGLAQEHEGLSGTLRSMHPQALAHPSVGLAALVLARRGHERAELRRLLTEGQAIRFGLLRLDGSEALFERSILLADGLWEALHGLDAFPAGLDRVICRTSPAGLDGWLAEPAVGRAARAVRDGASVTVLVHAADEAVALGRCAALAGSVGARLVAARVHPDDAIAIRLLGAHATVRDAVPVVVARPLADGAGAAELAVPELPGPMLVIVPAGAAMHFPAYRPVISVPVGELCAIDRRLAWLAALPEMTEADAAVLAGRHLLDPALIAPVALDAEAGRTPPDPVSIAGLIRARAAASLPPGIEVVTPSVPWTRLVLAEGAGFQLRDAVARLEHQALVLDDWRMREHARASRGVRLLLTGLPGTGKSLAAEAVATAAATDLLRVDVSQIVSKWIGETEKNLAAAFDIAERTQSVLLLDEADSLFGTRTEISDAHDRYANLETAYLLQRLDHFDGLAVLATNLRHNIDPAFVRRMDFVVDFPLPDELRRRELWQLHLPPERVSADVDLDVLARLYPIAGGWIRNAAIAAAFFAAAAGDQISQYHLVAAVRREYLKAALPCPGEPLPRRRDDS
jgi:hypothetical protein